MQPSLDKSMAWIKSSRSGMGYWCGSAGGVIRDEAGRLERAQGGRR